MEGCYFPLSATTQIPSQRGGLLEASAQLSTGHRHQALPGIFFGFAGATFLKMEGGPHETLLRLTLSHPPQVGPHESHTNSL